MNQPMKIQPNIFKIFNTHLFSPVSIGTAVINTNTTPITNNKINHIPIIISPLLNYNIIQLMMKQNPINQTIINIAQILSILKANLLFII